MNILIPNNLKAKEQYVKKAENKLEYKLMGSMRKIRGLYIFEYNTITEKLIQLEPEKKVVINMDKSIRKVTRVDYKANCWYFQAHNIRAAEKKIIKLLNQIKNV